MPKKSKENQEVPDYWGNITYRTVDNKKVAYWRDDTRPLYDLRHWNGERIYFFPHGLTFLLLFYTACVAPLFLGNTQESNNVQVPPVKPTAIPLPQSTETPQVLPTPTAIPPAPLPGIGR